MDSNIERFIVIPKAFSKKKKNTRRHHCTEM